MAKPIGLLLGRGLRIDFRSLVLASKLLIAAGVLVVGAVWVGLAPPDLALWLRIWGGAAVGFTALYFLTRTFRPPTPVAKNASCPRCSQALHHAGFECANCGVLSFSFDRATDEIEA